MAEMTGYVCNLVVPGAAKSGTSSLHSLLDRHPAICMSHPKEPHHFSMPDRFARGPEAHNAIFAAQGRDIRFYGESSTTYLVDEPSRHRLSRCLPGARIIIIMREPVARTLSHHRWMTRLGFERRSLVRAIAENGHGFDPAHHWDGNYKSYLQFSNYSRYIPKWAETFGADNVLLLRSEDLKRDQRAVLRRCLDFLGLPAIRVDGTVEKNRTEQTIRAMPFALRPVERRLPGRLRASYPYRALRWRLLRAATPKPAERPTDEEERALREALADDIAFYRALEPA
jgi:hypothetical protein